MTWQAASFVVLGCVLAAMFAWYERSRPPARVLALVAVLAALATVGRIAFAPIPNVKPVTDIALFAGYALGPVPGFMVGAVSALASNVFFGQGPFTPWQMVAWGITGVMGAGLAKVAGRDLGRWPLALWCGLAGAVFGAIMDLYQWTQGAGQDLAHYLAVSATSLPYNLAHVFGNVAFCLLLGPTFVRALRRYRRRFEVRWAAPVAAGCLALLVVAVAPSQAQASTASRAAAYVAAAQNSDGGFGGSPGASSTQLHTGWAALGLAAAGRNPAGVSRAGHSILDFMRASASSLTDTGDLERTILVLGASGVSPRAFAGRDLVSELLRRRSRSGAWDSTNHTAFGVLALRAAGRGTASSTRWLIAHQGSDGGYGFAPRAVSDADDTGAVLEALAAGGQGRSAAAKRAVAFLRKSQNADGGFGQMQGDDSNAQSTAWAVQGLVAAGVNPSSVRRGRRSPLTYLASLQAPDGSIRYSRTSRQTPVWVTAQAIDALERRAFPLHGRAPRTKAERRSATAAAAGGPPAPSTPHHRRAARRKAAPAKRAAPPAAAPVVTTPAPPVSAQAHRTSASAPRAGGSAWRLWAALGALAAIAGFAAWRVMVWRRNRPRYEPLPPAE